MVRLVLSIDNGPFDHSTLYQARSQVCSFIALHATTAFAPQTYTNAPSDHQSQANMDFDSIYNSVKSNDSVEGTDHYDAPEGADAFMPSATGNAAVTRIIQPSDMPASAVAAADTSMPAQPLQITDGDDNQVVESTDAFEATNAPDPNQAPDPDQKPKRKSSTKGRKLIRWNRKPKHCCSAMPKLRTDFS